MRAFDLQEFRLETLQLLCNVNTGNKVTLYFHSTLADMWWHQQSKQHWQQRKDANICSQFCQTEHQYVFLLNIFAGNLIQPFLCLKNTTDPLVNFKVCPACCPLTVHQVDKFRSECIIEQKYALLELVLKAGVGHILALVSKINLLTYYLNKEMLILKNRQYTIKTERLQNIGNHWYVSDNLLEHEDAEMDLFPLRGAINTQWIFTQPAFYQNCTHLMYFVSNFLFHPLYRCHNVSAQRSNGRDAAGWQ